MVSQVLPFSALFDLLRTRDLEIGLTEYRGLGLLLSRYDGCSRDELRSAVAALLARDRIEKKLIEDCFDELFAGTDEAPLPLASAPGQPTPQTKPRSRWFTRRPWMTAILSSGVLLFAVLLIPFALAITRAVAPPPPPDPPAWWHSQPLPVPPEGPPPETGLPPEPGSPPGPTRARWSALVPSAVLAFGAILALCVGHRTATRRASWVRTLRRTRLASVAGPRFYRWRVDDRSTAIPRHVVEEIATILGRRHEVARTGNHLDVDVSIRHTLEAGLFPRLVFEPPCRTLPLLVLHDVTPEMRPWRSQIDFLLTDLQRLGIPIRRYYFDVNPRLIWRSTADAGTSLDELARSMDDAALLIVSMGAGVRAALEAREETPERSWIPLLEKWAARSWVTPLTSRAHWRPELARLPLSVWPMTPGGLHGAARDLLFDASHRPTAPRDALAGARRVTSDDLERVKRLVAVVPRPAPVELVDALRARFTPDVPTDVLLPLLSGNDTLDSSSVRLPDREVERLLTALRREGPQRELAVRRFLNGLLEACEPPADSVAHLRWQTDIALHRAQIAELTGDAPGNAVRQLGSLAQSVIGDEVRARVAHVAAMGRVRGPLRWIAKSARPPVVRAGDAAPPRLVAPRLVDGIAAFAGAALAVGVFAGVGGVERQRLDHVSDVWTLAWDSERQALTVAAPSASAPRDAWLARDAVPLEHLTLPAAGGVIRDGMVSRGETGSWYRLQKELPEGNFLLSNAVYVPGPVTPGRVIATFRRDDGRPLNDVRFELTADSGESRVGMAGRPLPVLPGAWTLGVREPGYQPLYDRIIVQRDRDLRREFTLTADASATIVPGALRIGLQNVYGEAVLPFDAQVVQGGRTVRELAVGRGSSNMVNDVDWSAGPVEVTVTSPAYRPGRFAATGKPGSVVVAGQTLLMRPDAVRPEFPPQLPNELDRLLKVRSQGLAAVARDPQNRANLLNIFARTEKITVTLERPMGTFSRNIWSLFEAIEETTPQSARVIVASDYVAYMRTWMELSARGMSSTSKEDDNGGPDGSGPQQAGLQAQQQNAPRMVAAQTLSLRSPRAILDLQLAPTPYGGPMPPTRLTMSVRPATDRETHPYLLHQLLVLDGFRPRYRLRLSVADASAK